MTTIDRDRLRKLAAYYSQGDMGMLSGLSWGEVLALLDTLTRAEAERDAQTVQCHYWKALHERSEARLQARKAVHADQIKYWQGETRIASDDATRAEERIRAVRDLLDEHVYTHDGEPLRLPIPHDDLREALDGDA